MNYIYSEDVHNVYAPSIVLPILFNKFSISSIVDVGCGIGTWLHVAQNLGVSDILGIDSDDVDYEQLNKFINKRNFVSLDLSKHFFLDKKFDLVLCLEVAEHISKESADIFVNNLISHGDLILFSAAIPGQGGQNHVNENWPSYWIEKFSLYGFICYDFVRPKIWNNEKLEFWYKQNIFVFSKNKIDSKDLTFISVVHPELFRLKLNTIHNLQSDLDKYKSIKFVFRRLLDLLRIRLFH